MIPSLFSRLHPLLPALAALVLTSCGGRTTIPADLVFINGAEVGSIDPSQVSSQVDGRVVTSLFEGLMRYNV